MFLLPALVAGTSDILVIYLSHHDTKGERQAEGSEAAFENDYISNVSYLVPLAITRLILLLIPLPYHSYTGTAVKCPNFYRLFYGVTLAVVLIHMLSIIMLDPDSLSTFLPEVDRKLKHLSVMRHVWVMLTLSLVSTISHIVLLFHVRSTAQQDSLDSWKLRRKKVLYYYANQSQRRRNEGISGENGDGITLKEEHPRLPIEISNGSLQQKRFFPGEDLLQQMRENEFMSELQSRLDTARKEWTHRLEDATNRLASTTPAWDLQGGSRNGSSHGNNAMPPSSSSPFLQPSPFRVLLQLFAYEEVLANNRLDQVFDMDDGLSLTFYVPQLLSFLLHGAFQCSPQLEEWILNKCSKNVHFAHACFWFLRAWCLEGHSLKRTPSSHDVLAESIGKNGLHRRSLSGNSHTSLGSLNISESNLSPALKPRRFPSFGSLASDSSLDLETGNRRPSKLDPEETTLIQALMFRVMERGEIPAYTLNCGTGQAEENMNTKLPSTLDEDEGVVEHSSAAIANATATGFIPIDPNYGFPSVRHLESVSSKRKFGFMPLDARENWKITENYFDATPRFLDAFLSIADNLYLLPRERRTSELRKQLRVLEVELLPCNSIYVPIGSVHHRVWRIVADESIAISTKERVPCIICLEVVSYAAKKPQRKRNFLENALRGDAQQDQPASDDAALSHNTNNNNKTGKMPFLLPGQSPSLTEREILNLWQNSLRHPQRHNSLLDKVTNYTQMGFRKLVDHNRNQDIMVWGNEPSGSWKDLMRMSSSMSRERSQAEGDFDPEIAGLTASDSDRKSGSASRPPLPPSIPKLSPTVTPTKKPADRPSTPPSVQSSRPPSPASAMGQWSSPTPFDKTQKVISDDVVDSLMTIADPLSDEGGNRSKSPLNGSSSSVPSAGAAAYGAMREPSLLDANTGEQQKLLGTKGGDPGTETLVTKKKRRRPPPVVFKESWSSKQERIRAKSAYGSHPGWRLLPVLIKPNDDLRQEQLASQLIYRMASILAREKVPVWLCPYEIVALTDRGGIVEAIADTISIDSLKRNDPNFTSLSNFFMNHFGEGTDELADAKANFVESLAAYSIVCYLLQIKDRHNGNILLDNRGHLIHIDFGFFFLSSPGKNSGFESAPFKLTRDFVDLMEGPDSKTFRTFRLLCCRTFLSLRRHCYEITLLVEMLMVGNEDLACFRGRPEEAVQGLRERFRLSLNDRACMEYVNELVDESLVSWRTTWYDRYQRFCVGVL